METSGSLNNASGHKCTCKQCMNWFCIAFCLFATLAIAAYMIMQSIENRAIIQLDPDDTDIFELGRSYSMIFEDDTNAEIAVKCDELVDGEHGIYCSKPYIKIHPKYVINKNNASYDGNDSKCISPRFPFILSENDTVDHDWRLLIGHYYPSNYNDYRLHQASNRIDINCQLFCKIAANASCLDSPIDQYLNKNTDKSYLANIPMLRFRSYSFPDDNHKYCYAFKPPLDHLNASNLTQLTYITEQEYDEYDIDENVLDILYSFDSNLQFTTDPLCYTYFGDGLECYFDDTQRAQLSVMTRSFLCGTSSNSNSNDDVSEDTFFELCENCPTPFNVLIIGFYVEMILVFIFACDCGTSVWRKIQKRRGIKVTGTGTSCFAQQIRYYFTLFLTMRLFLGIIADALDLYESTEFESGWNDYQCMSHVIAHSSNIKIFVSLILTWLIYEVRNEENGSYSKVDTERKKLDPMQIIELLIAAIFVLMLIPPFITHVIPALFVYIWWHLILACLAGCAVGLIYCIFSPCGAGPEVLAFVAVLILPGAVYLMFVYYIDVMITFYQYKGKRYWWSYESPYHDRVFTEWTQCMIEKYDNNILVFIEFILTII